MAATRDAQRATPTAVVLAQTPPAVVESPPLQVELAKQSLEQAISGATGVSRAAAVLKSAEFGEYLLADQQYTIFVPSDAAFAANSEQIQQALLNDLSLQSMWAYLIVPQLLMASDLTSGSVPTLHGTPLSIDTSGGAVQIANASIVEADIEFAQGVIHIIDSTVLPK